MSEPLSKVDSAVQGLSTSPPKDDAAAAKPVKRRASSTNPDVHQIAELEEKGIDLEVAPETQKTGWKINQSPNTIEDTAILKLPLVKPMVKKIDLHIKRGGVLGAKVTARNLKGVTIKDALDAIYKPNKKRADDELEDPYLRGFEWDKEECYGELIVHLQKQPTQTSFGALAGGKKKKKNKQEE